MKRRSLLVQFTILLLAGCGGPSAVTQEAPRTLQGAKAAAPAATATVALAGNAFITSAPSGATEIINSNGLANWTSANTVASAWFRVNAAGNVAVAMDARLAGSASSTVRATVNGTPFTVNLSGAATRTYPIGTVNVAAPRLRARGLAGRQQERRLLR